MTSRRYWFAKIIALLPLSLFLRDTGPRRWLVIWESVQIDKEKGLEITTRCGLRSDGKYFYAAVPERLDLLDGTENERLLREIDRRNLEQTLDCFLNHDSIDEYMASCPRLEGNLRAKVA